MTHLLDDYSSLSFDGKLAHFAKREQVKGYVRNGKVVKPYNRQGEDKKQEQQEKKKFNAAPLITTAVIGGVAVLGIGGLTLALNSPEGKRFVANIMNEMARNAVVARKTKILAKQAELNKALPQLTRELDTKLAQAADLANAKSLTIPKVKVDKTKEVLIFGVSGTRSSTDIYWSPELRKMFLNSQVVDTPANSTVLKRMKDTDDFVDAVFDHYLDTYKKGYNDDSLTLAAQVMQVRRDNPNTKIVLSGHSAGTVITNNTQMILEKAGITDVKVLNFGGYGDKFSEFLPKPRNRNYLADDDGLVVQDLVPPAPNTIKMSTGGHSPGAMINDEYARNKDSKLLKDMWNYVYE